MGKKCCSRKDSTGKRGCWIPDVMEEKKFKSLKELYAEEGKSYEVSGKRKTRVDDHADMEMVQPSKKTLKVSGPSKKTLQRSRDVRGDNGSKNDDEVQREHDGGLELKEECISTIGETGASDLKNKRIHSKKHKPYGPENDEEVRREHDGGSELEDNGDTGASNSEKKLIHSKKHKPYGPKIDEEVQREHDSGSELKVDCINNNGDIGASVLEKKRIRSKKHNFHGSRNEEEVQRERDGCITNNGDTGASALQKKRIRSKKHKPRGSKNDEELQREHDGGSELKEDCINNNGDTGASDLEKNHICSKKHKPYGSKNDEEVQREHDSGLELKEDCVNNNGDTAHSKKHKPCKSKAVHRRHVFDVDSIPTSSGTETRKDGVEDMETNSSMMKKSRKIHNQKEHIASIEHRLEVVIFPEASNKPSDTNDIMQNSLIDATTHEENLLQVNCLSKQAAKPVQTTKNKTSVLGYSRKNKKKCDDKLMERLESKQLEEVKEMNKKWEEKKAELENNCRKELTAISSSQNKSLIGVDKLRILDDTYTMKRKELESQILAHREELEARHRSERDKLQKKAQKKLSNKLTSENEPLPVVEDVELTKLSNEMSSSGTTVVISHLDDAGIDSSEAIVVSDDSVGCEIEDGDRVVELEVQVPHTSEPDVTPHDYHQERDISAGSLINEPCEFYTSDGTTVEGEANSDVIPAEAVPASSVDHAAEAGSQHIPASAVDLDAEADLQYTPASAVGHAAEAGLPHTPASAVDHAAEAGSPHMPASAVDHAAEAGSPHMPALAVDHAAEAGSPHMPASTVDHAAETGSPHMLASVVDHAAEAGSPHMPASAVDHAAEAGLPHMPASAVEHDAEASSPHVPASAVSAVDHDSEAGSPHRPASAVDHDAEASSPHIPASAVDHSAEAGSQHIPESAYDHSAASSSPHIPASAYDHSAESSSPQIPASAVDHSAESSSPHVPASAADHAAESSSPHVPASAIDHAAEASLPHVPASAIAHAAEAGSPHVPASAVDHASEAGSQHIPASVVDHAPEAGSQHVPTPAVDHVAEAGTQHIPAPAVDHVDKAIQWPTFTISELSKLSSNPLVNELRRTRGEIWKIMESYESKKSELKSACDREIEEAAAQIRMKYDGKLQQVDALFSFKRNELEMYHDMVMMHAYLAKAFDILSSPKAPSEAQQASTRNPPSGSLPHNTASAIRVVRPAAVSNPTAGPPLINTVAQTAPHQPVRGPAPNHRLESSSSAFVPIPSTSMAPVSLNQWAPQPPIVAQHTLLAPLDPQQDLTHSVRTSNGQSHFNPYLHSSMESGRQNFVNNVAPPHTNSVQILESSNGGAVTLQRVTNNGNIAFNVVASLPNDIQVLDSGFTAVSALNPPTSTLGQATGEAPLSTLCRATSEVVCLSDDE